jgi:hypothetical protein
VDAALAQGAQAGLGLNPLLEMDIFRARTGQRRNRAFQADEVLNDVSALARYPAAPSTTT